MHPRNRRPSPDFLRILAGLGLQGDNAAVHATRGEMVVPPQIMNPKLWAALSEAYDRAGVDPAEFVVGSGRAKVNPLSGAEMFALDKSRDIGRYSAEPASKAAAAAKQSRASGGSDKSGMMGAYSAPKVAGLYAAPAQPTNAAAAFSAPATTFNSPVGPMVLPPQRPANRVQADLGNASAFRNANFNPSLVGALGFNVGRVPHYQANSAGGVDAAWDGAVAFSPTRAAGGLASMLLGPAGSLLNAGADAAGLYPSDWQVLDGEAGPGVGGPALPSGNGRDALNAQLGAQANPAGPARPAAFARPALGTAPSFLALDAGMSPLQMRSRIATYATNSDDSRYRDKEVADFYDRLLANALIEPGGNLLGLDQLLPIESQYLTNSRGLAPWDSTAGLLEQLGFKPSRYTVAQALAA